MLTSRNSARLDKYEVDSVSQGLRQGACCTGPRHHRPTPLHVLDSVGHGPGKTVLAGIHSLSTYMQRASAKTPRA